MSHLDLSVPASKAWRECLPEDFRRDIPDDAGEVPSDIMAWFNGNKSAEEVSALIGASPYQFGKTQGLMVLCWLADSPSPITAGVKNKSIADAMNAIVEGAIAMRLTRGIIAKNADVILAINANKLNIPEEALVPKPQMPTSAPKPSLGMGDGR